jgi:hypothetical protein
MGDLKKDSKIGKLKINELIITGAHHFGLTQVIPNMDFIRAMMNNLGLTHFLDSAPPALIN